MVGFVTTRHLLTHSAVIVKEFGTVCLLRCLWRTLTADHAVTFLECTVPIYLPLPSTGTPTSLDRAKGNESDPAEILMPRASVTLAVPERVLPPLAPRGATRMPPAASSAVRAPGFARDAAASS
jgi:hypothetical protein